MNLLGGVGFWVDEVEDNLATAGAHVLSEHLPHTVSVIPEWERQGAEAAREIKIELDRFLDLGEERFGAG